MMEIRAIPTLYQGVRFRSRLEARWAAFFTLFGWKWEYEPVDLNGYIPDFFVEHGQRDNWIATPLYPNELPIRRLVEVKPEPDRLNLTAHIGKLEQSGWDGPMAVVGSQLWEVELYGIELGIQRLQDETLKWGWGSWPVISRARAKDAWKEAANMVQWQGRDA